MPSKTKLPGSLLRGFTLLFLALGLSSCIRPEEQGIRCSKDGSITYIEDQFGNHIPDYTRVGYKAGEVSIPQAKVILRLQPSPDGDDSPRIQAALDQIGNLPISDDGLRGALLLEAGIYRINKPIRLNADGVCLIGEGTDPEGTRIFFQGSDRDSAIIVSKEAPTTAPLGMVDPREVHLSGTKTSKAIMLLDGYAPSGRDFIQPMMGHGFEVGDTILIEQKVKHSWLQVLRMDQPPENKPDLSPWDEKDFVLQFEKEVTAIDGGRVYLDTPLVNPINRKTDNSYVYAWQPSDRVSNVGVEKLSLIAAPTNKPPRSRIAIRVCQARDCWISEVDAFRFTQATVSAERDSRHITIEQCSYFPSYDDNRGLRQGFCVAGHGILVVGCLADEAKLSFVTEGLSAGPNVFSHCLANGKDSRIGPWRLWSMGTLYDQVKANRIYCPNYYFYSNVAGWAGINTLFWNSTAKESIQVQSPTNGWNWAIGCMGERADYWTPGLNGFFSKLHRFQNPESLFLRLHRLQQGLKEDPPLPPYMELKNLRRRQELAKDRSATISFPNG